MYNWALIILLSMALFSGCVGPKEEVTPTTAAPATPPPTPIAVEIKWKGAVTDPYLVKVVNFLINNKGKEIELAGEKHVITGKEELDVKISVLDCCTEEDFGGIINTVNTCGKVRDSNFEEFSIRASLLADEIPKIDDIGNVAWIKFEPEAKDFWMQVVG
jgi:hypothetical protein